MIHFFRRLFQKVNEHYLNRNQHKMIKKNEGTMARSYERYPCNRTNLFNADTDDPNESRFNCCSTTKRAHRHFNFDGTRSDRNKLCISEFLIKSSGVRPDRSTQSVWQPACKSICRIFWLSDRRQVRCSGVYPREYSIASKSNQRPPQVNNNRSADSFGNLMKKNHYSILFSVNTI